MLLQAEVAETAQGSFYPRSTNGTKYRTVSGLLLEPKALSKSGPGLSPRSPKRRAVLQSNGCWAIISATVFIMPLTFPDSLKHCICTALFFDLRGLGGGGGVSETQNLSVCLWSPLLLRRQKKNQEPGGGGGGGKFCDLPVNTDPLFY